MILSVSRPMLPEFDLLQEGQILLGFFHLAVAHPGKIELMLKRNVTAIAYETIQTEDGHLPVLTAVSQIAGRMIAHRGRTVPAERPGRARRPPGRRAGRAAGQGDHPGRGDRRRQRGPHFPRRWARM